MKSFCQFSKIYLYVLWIVFYCGCTNFSESWKYRGNSEAHGVLANLRWNADYLHEELGKIKDCVISKSSPAQPPQMSIRGQMIIQKGFLYVSSVEPISTNESAKKTFEKCSFEFKNKPKINVANGVLYHSALLKKDFIYRFEGMLTPQVAGTIKADDYDEVENF